MNFLGLSLLVWLPFVVGLVLVFQKKSDRTGRIAAFVTALWTLLCVLALAFMFKPNGGLQAIERYNWLRPIGLEYHLAVDGISLVFLLLCAFVFLISILACRWMPVDNRFYGLVLLLLSGLLGTFTAQNFLHFFFYWEVSLIPAFFLVKLYGGNNRNFAALQFFIYTMVGSIAMLLAFLAIGFKIGSFEFSQLAAAGKNGGIGNTITWTGLSPKSAGTILFLLAFLGVAVKVPLWPFHSWQPITYVEAPTPVTMMLTGVMSKMGVYALLRLILPVFPEQIEALHRPLLLLAVITILYGAWAAFGQRDIKRLFAYSSLSHLGYCFLAVFAAGRGGIAGLDDERAAAVNGVILQALSHGVVAAALFAFVAFLERRTDGLRSFENFGGLRKINPVFAGLMGITVFASLGLPGLSGFPAEFLIFKGAFPLAPLACAAAVLGLLLTAVYLLTFFGNVFFGPLNEKRAQSAELTLDERAIVIPAIVIAFILGLAPQLVIALFNPAVTSMVQQLR
jgi:NADH-quinone oxidoreductase subunit M